MTQVLTPEQETALKNLAEFAHQQEMLNQVAIGLEEVSSSLKKIYEQLMDLADEVQWRGLANPWIVAERIREIAGRVI